MYIIVSLNYSSFLSLFGSTDETLSYFRCHCIIDVQRETKATKPVLKMAETNLTDSILKQDQN